MSIMSDESQPPQTSPAPFIMIGEAAQDLCGIDRCALPVEVGLTEAASTGQAADRPD